MPLAIEIAFHNIEGPEWAEAEIRERVAHLEKIYDRLTSCRIHVDQRAKSSSHTVPPVVHIELGIPGSKPIVVSHEPDHLMRTFQRPDLRNAIHEAFRIAERRLLDLKEQRSRRTKEAHHDSSNQALGQIADIDPDGEYGFLLTKEGNRLYFHRNSVLSGEFDSLRRGDEIYYVEEMADTGPIASKVRVKSRVG